MKEENQVGMSYGSGSGNDSEERHLKCRQTLLAPLINTSSVLTLI